MDVSISALLFALLFLLLGFGGVVFIDPYIRKQQRAAILIIVMLSLSLIAQNIIENELFIHRSNLVVKEFLSAYGYSVRPMILILFLHIIEPYERRWPEWALSGGNALLYFTSPFTGFCFEIREADYAFLRGPLWFVCFIFSAILLIELLKETIFLHKACEKRERWFPIMVVLMIIAAVVLDLGVGMEPQPISFLTIAIIIGSVFYYIWLHLQFVREHEQDLMAAQRIQIMMTQIQPHFLFNALNTIRALYAKDPPLADRTLEDFSTWLRQNLESLSQTDLVPVTKELEHTRLYAEIEVLRFPNIRVEYQIEDDQFMIPMLTIQPLVENAIRHGVRNSRDGLVTVSIVMEGGDHRITVQDNGIGFDPGGKKPVEGSHIGLQNVKERVERMCHGTMLLHSEIGKGTCVTLLIPDRVKGGREKKK